MPAPTPQLLEAFSVEPQGSAGFFFRFKYSIQASLFTLWFSLPLFCCLRRFLVPEVGHGTAAARSLLSSICSSVYLISSQSTSRLLSGHSCLVDVTVRKDIPCARTNIRCDLSCILTWYYSYSLHTMVTDSPVHKNDPYNHPSGPL